MTANNTPQSPINFKLLRAFQLVAEHRSFRAAADLSNRSASAITMQIRELEEQLGVALFHRTSRRVQLTPEGEFLLESVKKATNELDGALQQIQNAVDLQRGHLSMAAIPTIAQVALPTALVAFNERFPGISVHLRESGTSELLETVRHGDVEFGLGCWVRNRNEFNFHQVLEDPICAIFPVSHPLARQRTISFEQAIQYPLLTLAPQTSLRMHLDNCFQARDAVLKPRYESHQAATMVAMSAAGLGVALLTRMSLANCSSDAIRVVPISDDGFSLPLCIITRRGHRLSPSATELVAIIESQLKQREQLWAAPAAPVARARKKSAAA